MAGVVIEEKDEVKLKNIGVKDSKLLTPQQRNQLFEKIIAIVKEFEIIILQPKVIDTCLNDPNHNLNWLEADTSAKIINKLNPDKAILDCPSNNIKSYREYVKKQLNNNNIDLIAEHKADLNYTIVGAASILAKVTRDQEIEKLKRKIKIDFGSGYPSDPKTVAFLKENYNKYDIFRKTWSSYKKIAEAKNTSTLGNL